MTRRHSRVGLFSRVPGEGADGEDGGGEAPGGDDRRALVSGEQADGKVGAVKERGRGEEHGEEEEGDDRRVRLAAEVVGLSRQGSDVNALEVAVVTGEGEGHAQDPAAFIE